MLRRIAQWTKERAAILTLWACTVVPALGWTVNTAWPAEVYGYLHEMALLVVFGIAALLLARDTVKLAMTLYFIGALLPVGAMVEYHTPGFTPLLFVPVVGVFVVSSLVHCPWATAAYTAAASLAGFIFGLLYADLGGAVAAVFVTLMIGAAKVNGCANYVTPAQARLVQVMQPKVEQVIQRVEGLSTKTGQLERGLDNLLKEHTNGQTNGPP